QQMLIPDVLGLLTLDEFHAITTSRSRDHIHALPFAQLFPNLNPLAGDFLAKMLTFNPKKCMSRAEVLAHPYFKVY
ncbi:hypothetical protein DFH07DRAFT_731780, partial [Mycena maculata]